jgi:hypothetical protein
LKKQCGVSKLREDIEIEAQNTVGIYSLLITSTLAIRLLVLSQLGKKQRRSLKWPLTVKIFVYIRGTVPSELDRN